jgi:hypothetical protein
MRPPALTIELDETVQWLWPRLRPESGLITTDHDLTSSPTCCGASINIAAMHGGKDADNWQRTYAKSAAFSPAIASMRKR